MQNLIRGLVGVVGLLALTMALSFWIDPARPAARLGLEAVGSLGLASLRADLGGFFGAAGALALLAAIRNRADLLLAPLVMIGIALSGRVITLMISGPSPALIPPMVVEAVLLAILILGMRGLARPQA